MKSENLWAMTVAFTLILAISVLISLIRGVDLTLSPHLSTNNAIIYSKSRALININGASEDMLLHVDGIGDALARSIVDHREENGGFARLEDVMNIDGIGGNKLKIIEEMCACVQS